MDIIEHIKKTRAYSNPFFRHCKEWGVTSMGLVNMASNWEMVTRKFWLSTCSLAGALASHYHTPPDLLVSILKIAAEDGGIGGGAVNGRIGPPHYELYRQLWNWDTRTVDWNRKPEPETKRLVDSFVFPDRPNTALVAGALANVVIVETIASNIVEAMICAHQSACVYPNPTKPGYLELHQNLELEHAAAMPTVATLAEDHGMDLWSQVQWRCETWGGFWQAMDHIVFGC